LQQYKVFKDVVFTKESCAGCSSVRRVIDI
jgi:hypothetical protein